MSHRRKAKDRRKAERESMDISDLCIPHITIDVMDLLCGGRHVPIPDDVMEEDPFVSFTVDEGMIEYGHTLHLEDVFEDPDGNMHYTFTRGIVSVVISRSDIETLLRIKS